MTALPDPQRAHAHTMRNRDEIQQSSTCGCAHCLHVFAPQDITDWWDAPQGTPDALASTRGQTAVCPHCGIDAVLGSASGFPITPSFLQWLRVHCF